MKSLYKSIFVEKLQFYFIYEPMENLHKEIWLLHMEPLNKSSS